MQIIYKKLKKSLKEDPYPHFYETDGNITIFLEPIYKGKEESIKIDSKQNIYLCDGTENENMFPKDRLSSGKITIEW